MVNPRYVDGPNPPTERGERHDFIADFKALGSLLVSTLSGSIAAPRDITQKKFALTEAEHKAVILTLKDEILELAFGKDEHFTPRPGGLATDSVTAATLSRLIDVDSAMRASVTHDGTNLLRCTFGDEVLEEALGKDQYSKKDLLINAFNDLLAENFVCKNSTPAGVYSAGRQMLPTIAHAGTTIYRITSRGKDRLLELSSRHI